MTPLSFIVFGSTGDLMQEKLIPAFAGLFRRKNVAEGSHIIAVGRRDYTTDEYLHELKSRVKDAADYDTLKDVMTYVKIDVNDSDTYTEIINARPTLHADRIFYLAVPPRLFPIITEGLSVSKLLVSKNQAHRIVFEKPYGENLNNARLINDQICQYVDESQIYRIDHYLGKEMMQTLLALRFANKIFENVWDRKAIDSVTIVAKESIGVKDRGPYFDHIGALKDMVQSHLLQMAALVAMDEPSSMDAEAIRDEKVKVLGAISVDPNSIVMGQYAGYLAEKGVAEASTTETAVYFKACLNNDRFLDVPFYFLTGKMLTEKRSEIIIKFKPHSKANTYYESLDLMPNELRIKVAPEEGAAILFNIKKPGIDQSISDKEFTYFHDEEAIGNNPEAYEKLLLEVVHHRPTLFTRWDEIETAWTIIDSIKDRAKAPKPYTDSESFEALLEAHRLEVGHDLRCVYDDPS